MALNAEFSDVFSVAVQKEPARIDPYEIDVDLEKWNSSRLNRSAARLVSQAGDAGSSERPDRIVA